MSDNLFPGVFVEEVPGGVHPIEGVSTTETAFVDVFANGPLDEATRINSFAEFETIFGGLDARSEASYGIQQFFLNGGRVAWVVRVAGSSGPGSTEWHTTDGANAILGKSGDQKGIYALKAIAPPGFNVLCLPAAANLSLASQKNVYDEAAKFCNEARAFLIVDVPPGTDTPKKVTEWLDPTINPAAIKRDQNAAVYFPRVMIADPLNGNQQRDVGPSGTMAGLYARTDAERGVWKAPAGRKASLRGVNLVAKLTDDENGVLNPLAINALRNFPIAGNVCWGARTLAGADRQGSDWKYIPVRRMALFIESSLCEGLKWVVFEPNDQPLWAQIRLNVGAFMQDLFRQGTFQGATPKHAYFVKCDKETTTLDDINRGVVNIIIGFAPLKPAEFVIIKIQQITGRTAE